MSSINQLYTLLNQVTKDATQGTTNPNVANLTGVISLGNTLQNDANLRDNWIAALADRIGRTVVDNRPYRATKLSMMRESFEMGSILQKIYTPPIQAVKNDQWGVTDKQDYSPFIVNKMTSYQKLFEGIDTWSFNYTIPNEQLFTAFVSETALGAYISSLYEAAATSYELYIENMERLVNANFMAEKIKYANTTGATGIHVINLLTEYNAGQTTQITAAQALTDMGFLKMAAYRINSVINFMRNLGTMFNTEGYYRHTPKDRMRVLMLSQFAMAVPYYLQADTFHDNLIPMPMYAEIDFWQYPGSGFSFTDNSSINVVTASGTSIKQNGIVCCVSDIDALGMFIQKRSNESIYNPRITATHHYDRTNLSYFNNLSENGVVFVVADTETEDEVNIPQSTAIADTAKAVSKTK